MREMLKMLTGKGVSMLRKEDNTVYMRRIPGKERGGGGGGGGARRKGAYECQQSLTLYLFHTRSIPYTTCHYIWPRR